MPSLEQIQEISRDEIELLNAAGYLAPKDLHGVKASILHHELTRANSHLAIIEQELTIERVEELLSFCNLFNGRSPIGSVARSVEVAQQGDLAEEDPRLASEDEDGVPRVFILDSLALSRAGALPAFFPVGQQVGGEKGRPTILKPSDGLVQELKLKGAKIDGSRVKSLDEYSEGKMAVQPLEKGESSITNTTLAETNRGVKPESRRFIRGVLHPNPVALWFSALWVVLLPFLIIASLAATVGLYTLPQEYHRYAFIPVIGFLLVGVMYLFQSAFCRCRVCRQKLFTPKSSLKNKKAHRFLGTGYIFPMALHGVVFRWFRCPHCGTAARMKK